MTQESDLLRLMTHDQIHLPSAAVKILFEERLARQEFTSKAIESRITEVREFILGLIASNEKAVGVAMTAADRAVIKAENAAEKRFEAVNEFRAALTDQAATLISRTEHASEIRGLNEKIDVINKMVTDLSSRLTRQEGRGSGFQQSWSVFIAIAGIVTIFLVELLHRQ